MAVSCLTIEQKRRIQSDIANEVASRSELAELFNVSTRTIGRVVAEELDNTSWHPVHPRVESPFEGLDSQDEDEDLDEEEYYEDDDDEDLEEDEDEDLDVAYEYFVTAATSSISITRVEVGTTNHLVSTVDSSHDKFTQVSDIVWGGRGSQECLVEAFAIINAKARIEALTEGRVTVDPELGQVSVDVDGITRVMHGRLVSRLITAAQEGEASLSNLMKFTDKLADNPSYRAVNELYDFLEAADIKINEDGDVVCYKKVRVNFTDIHSGTFDNSPGSTCQVTRNMVDEDSSQTCSYGLHVCSKAYLPSFGGYNDVVVEVTVRPSDFVAIPKDYYSNDAGRVKAKARVSRYVVNREIPNEELDLN